MTLSLFPSSLTQLLICPNCGQSASALFESAPYSCQSCGAEHFHLGDIPCLFPHGIHQRFLWQHQAGVMQSIAFQNFTNLRESLTRHDVSDRSRERLAGALAATELSQNTIFQLLDGVGLTPEVREGLAPMTPGEMGEYFDLILRDWAWDAGSDQPSIENGEAIARILPLIKKKRPKVLVIGAGAGRLSWDLHKAIAPELTVALDSHPVLLAASNHLIKRQLPMVLGELKTFSQQGFDLTREWYIEPVDDQEKLRETWFAFGADAWRMPFKPASFDIVITPWFLDVNGGDCRDLMGIIDRLLVDGGQWINSGPLLFTRHLALQLKYSHDEIREFMALTGFTLDHEQFDAMDHLVSPLDARRQHEQLWTFSATKDKQLSQSVSGVAAPWLVMHHLPVPQGNYVPEQEHPIIDAILSLIDGERSINDIGAVLAPHLPEDVSSKDLVVTLLGQMLQSSAS